MSLELAIPLMAMRIARSVRIGNVLVSAKEVDACLSRYCEAVHCMAQENTPFVSLAGSMTLLNYRNLHFGLITQHQIKDHNIESLCIPGVQKNRFISSNGFIFVNSPRGAGTEDRYDVGMLRFDEPISEGWIETGRFFPLNDMRFASKHDHPVAYIAIGHAFADQKIEIDEHPDSDGRMLALGLVRRICVCTEDGRSADSSLLRLKTANPARFDSNGFSGGATFAIMQDEYGQYEAKFAGIICRGGTGTTLHAIRASALRDFLDGMLSEFHLN